MTFIHPYSFVGMRDVVPNLTDAQIANYIVDEVCIRLGIERQELAVKSRKPFRVYARQLCCYLIKERTKINLGDIPQYYNAIQDHTTVIHSIRTIKNLSDVDEKVREDVTRLNSKIKNQFTQIH